MKIKTLILISYFKLSKKRNDALGIRILKKRFILIFRNLEKTSNLKYAIELISIKPIRNYKNLENRKVLLLFG